MAGNNGPRKVSSPKTSGKNTGGEDGQAANALDLCDLTIDVDLEGIRPSAMVGLKGGDPLGLELIQTSNYPVVVCKRLDGTIVGSLAAFLNVTQLVRCLQMGVRYKVWVTHADGGRCRVFGRRV